MKWRILHISSSFYISISHLPTSKSSPFSIFPFFPFTFHTHCISSTYDEPTLFLLSHSFHTILFVIQSEAKDLGNTNLSIPYPHSSKCLHPNPKISASISKSSA